MVWVDNGKGIEERINYYKGKEEKDSLMD